MNHKKKLGYIGLGAVIMLIGLGVEATLTPQLVAQHNGVFNKITCEEFEVVDKTGKRIAFLGRAKTKALSSSRVIEGNVFQIFDKDGEKAITLAADDLMREVLLHNNAGDTTVRLFAGVIGFSAIQVFNTDGDKGFEVSLFDDLHSITLYDPSEQTTVEVEGHKFVQQKEAFNVSVSNTRNALQVWGKPPHQMGIGFYADSNEARQTTWSPPKEGNTR